MFSSHHYFALDFYWEPRKIATLDSKFHNQGTLDTHRDRERFLTISGRDLSFEVFIDLL